MASQEQGPGKGRTAIAAELLRLGFLSGVGDSEEEAIVEALATILPEAHIAVCVPYSDFSSTQAHPFQERTCSFLRVLPPMFGSRSGKPIMVPVPKMRIVLRTDELLLWTSSQVESGGAVLEEKVSAQMITFDEVLGAAVAGKHEDVVHVWVDEGPTLAFHTEPAWAQALQVYVDTAASRS